MYQNNKIKSHGEVSLKVVSIIYTFLALVLLLLPFAWLISSALKDNVAIYQTPPRFVPAVPIRQEIDIDYTGLAIDGSLEEVIKKDAVSIIWGTAYEFTDDNIQKVQVNAYKDGKIRYSVSAQNYKVRSASTRIMKTVSYTPEMVDKHYSKLLEWVNIKKLDKNSKINSSNEDGTIEEYIISNYDIKGEITGTAKFNDPIQFFNNFISAWKSAGEFGSNANKFGFGRYILNSVFVTIFAIAAQLVISSLAGYSLAKLIKGKLSTILLIFFLATMMIPFISTLLPMYIIFKQFKLLDSLWGLILPSTSWGFAIYLFKGFFDKLPKDLMEAARIDGSSELNTFVRVAVPLSKPVFGVIALWTFLAVWNDFMWPNIIIQQPNLWTFTVALYKVQNQGMASFFANESMALNLIAVLPALVVMLVFQKSIQKGITFSGIKG